MCGVRASPPQSRGRQETLTEAKRAFVWTVNEEVTAVRHSVIFRGFQTQS